MERTDIDRRRVAWALAAALPWACGMGKARAQDQLSVKLGSVGVFSLLGDTVQATWSDDKPRDTRIEKTGHESLDFKGIGFDLIALRVARAALFKLEPKPDVDLFQSPQALTPSEQREVAEKARGAVLPDWMVKAINDNRLAHVLLITRGRGPILARTGSNQSVGRGMVDGIGLYMDTLYTGVDPRTGARSTGLIAPYVEIRLQLLDVASGNITNEYAVRDAFLWGDGKDQTKADPWNFMPDTVKVRVLRDLVQKGMTRGMQALLSKGS